MNKQVLKLGARILENLPVMSSGVMQGWIDNPMALKKFLSGLVPAETHFTSLTPLTVASNDVNPSDFFKIREGLWTTNNFDKLIPSGAAKKKVSVDDTTIGYADLAQSVTAAEIGSEFPEGYVFEDVGTFLALLATLIEGQWGGKAGTLLNNGYANIFYVKVNGEVLPVGVGWSTVSRRWLCDADRLDAYRWFDRYRAFSATAAQA